MLDLAIIGGGPAGLTAGLYATRGGLNNVVMFEMECQEDKLQVLLKLKIIRTRTSYDWYGFNGNLARTMSKNLV